ncbi:MAG: FeoB-associated Cys-rich membrane protein [Clostridiales bacterium]|jgi:hypothetical protein|nr:FeoB-associated Cys-rich membrane protein [Clostridiales bacterium]
MEILIAIGIVIAAAYLLYRSAKKKTKGGCACESCTTYCPLYEEKKAREKKKE